MKILNFEIGEDKIQHFTLWAGLSFVLFILLGIYWGLFWAIVFGIGKELYDRFIKETEFSYSDLIADGLGVLVSLMIVKFFGILV